MAQYDSLRVIDLSVIHDTIAVLRTETLWREPDSLGNIYPLMTVNEERAAWRETENNIVGTRVDTVYIVNHRDGSSIDEVNQRTVPAIAAVRLYKFTSLESDWLGDIHCRDSDNLSRHSNLSKNLEGINKSKGLSGWAALVYLKDA